MIGTDDSTKIVDFGLALLAEHEAEERGEVWGTPYYVAPEKLAAEREAVQRVGDYNQHYAEFLNRAVFPAVDELVAMLAEQGIEATQTTVSRDLVLPVTDADRASELGIAQEGVFHQCFGAGEGHAIEDGRAGG